MSSGEAHTVKTVDEDSNIESPVVFDSGQLHLFEMIHIICGPPTFFTPKICCDHVMQELS